MPAIKDTLTREGYAKIRQANPEFTPRKSVTVALGNIACDTLGVTLTLEQALAMYHAHETLSRKNAGRKADNPEQRGIWHNEFSAKITSELHAKLKAKGVNLTKPDLVARAK